MRKERGMMTSLFVNIIFLFPYSQIVLFVVGYALSILANVQRAQNDMMPMSYVPYRQARMDWKLADTLALVAFGFAIFTAVAYLFIAGSIQG